MDIKVGVGSLGLDITVEGVGSLLGFSGGFRGSLAISAYDSVVRNGGSMVKGIGGCLSRPEQGTHKEVVPPEGVVLPDYLAVDVGQPKEDREDGNDETGEDDGQCHSDFRELVEVEIGGALVD